MGQGLGICAAGLAAVCLTACAPATVAIMPDGCARQDILIGGEPAGIVGAEDLAFDPHTGVLFVSAFDRRAVAEALEKNTPPPDGILILAERGAEGWDAQSVAVGLPAGEWRDQFRPHGIALSPAGDRLAVINRRYEGKRRHVSIELFGVDGAVVTHQTTIRDEALCRGNDVTFADTQTLLVSVDHAACADWAAAVEDVFSLRRSGVLVVPLDDNGAASAPRMAPLGRGFRFANGITWSDADDGAWLAATREKRLYFLPREQLFPDAREEPPREVGSVALSGHPDNISQAADGSLLVAQHTNLISLALHRANIRGGASAQVARVEPEGERIVYRDPSGANFSAATVAVEAGGQLILGSATDAGVMVCEDMPG